VDAKRCKSGAALVMAGRRFDVRFSSVGRLLSVDIFSFINEEACSQMKVLPNKLAPTAFSEPQIRILVATRILTRTNVKKIACFEFRPKFITAVLVGYLEP
jgi:hypothetical protein